MSRNLIFAVCVFTAALAAAAWLAAGHQGRAGESNLRVARAAQLNPHELRFAADSPQLSFIKVEAVEALPDLGLKGPPPQPYRP